MNLYQVFSEQIARRPGVIAIIDAKYDRGWGFGELENASANAASRLAASGLRAGDGVLLLVPMSIELYVTLLACFRLGLAVVIIDPYAGREHIERCCRLYPPRAFIGTPRAHLLRLSVPALRAIPRRFSTSRLVPGSAHLPLDVSPCEDGQIVEVDESQAALISFTSGTGGKPKIAVRGHGFLLEQHRVINRNQRASAGTSSLTLFPAFVLSNLAAGITSILADVDLRQPQRIDAARLVQALRRYRPDSLGLQPVVLARLVEYCHRTRQQLDGDFTVYSGGAPVFPALLERFRQVAPGAGIVSVYGSTEAEPIALSERGNESAAAATDCERGILAGKPVPEIELRIVRIDRNERRHEMEAAGFDAICVADGAIGEIVVSGKHVLKSYLHGDGDCANKYRVNGVTWHRTGDAGSIDSCGRLWLAGRCAARIEDRRGIRYPLGVEAVVAQFEAVERAALIGDHGDRLLAIECRTAQRESVTAKILKSRIAGEFDEMRFLRRIPVDRRHNGKIDYARLRELLD